MSECERVCVSVCEKEVRANVCEREGAMSSRGDDVVLLCFSPASTFSQPPTIISHV